MYGCKVGYTQSITTIFSSPNRPFEATKDDISWIASISFTGTIVSLIISYTIGSKVGRKTLLSGCALTFAVVWLLILITSSVLVIIVCFLFYGIAATLLLIIGTTYFGETASPRNREILGIFYCIATAAGGLTEFSLSTFNNYRLLAIFPMIMSVITILSSYLMVESPYYLVSHEMYDKAVRNICWLEDKTDIEDVAEQLDGVKKYVDEHKYETIGNMKTIFFPSNLKLILAMIVVNIAAFVESSTIVSQYGAVLVQPLKSTIEGTLFVGAFNIIGIFGLIASLYTVRKFSRKGLLLGGFLIAGFVQLGAAIGFYIEEQNGNQIRYLALIIAFLLVLLPLASAASIYATLSVFRQEVFPHKLKEFYCGLLAITGDCTTFITVKMYPSMASSIGNHNVLAIYAGTAFVAAVVTYYCLRDTKGKSLLQIRQEYTSF